MIFGVFIKLGYFPLLNIYFALVVGDLLGDIFWYWLGRKWGHPFIKRFGKYMSITEEGVEKVTKIFHAYKYPILIISKITNGFGFALVTLMTAGMIKIPFLKYLGLNLIGQFIWTGILVSIGYYFSNAYLEVNGILAKMGIIALFIILILIFLGFLKYVHGRLSKK